MLFIINVIFCKKLVQYNEYLISTVDTDGLVLQHQAISSHSAEYTPMHFQLFMGYQDNLPGDLSWSHSGRVTLICDSKLTNIVSDNDLLPGRHQAIIWINVGILLIRPLETNFSEILINIHIFSFKKMYLKISSPFCLCLNVLSETTATQLKIRYQ